MHSLRWSLCLMVVLCLGSVGTLMAQDPPATDIWLLSIEPGTATSEGVPTVGSPRNLTDRQGYDNQPHFLPGGDAVLYTSIRDGQADIYRYDLKHDRAEALTKTAESEYSPTPLPTGDGFSVVRVEEDDRQRLWRFDLDGKNPQLLLPDVEPVGYHAWGKDGELALFVLGEPHRLHRAKLGTPGSSPLADDIGRSLAPIPGHHAVSFIHKVEAEGEDGWQVRRLDLDSGKIEPLIAALPGREDVAWAPDGTLWGADGGKLYRWCPFCSGRWQLVADLETSHGLTDITRLAIDPDGKHLALVSARASVTP